ncbi:response regulator transcription factor [Pseudolysinimonas sp.]|uniref:response regulator transcription factor n=1 Tax=Pseudolysinimonas sp. TaxID=2680009 RepID=UPI00286AE745|nr:response regulator transcription factor [Pseudolysinimonas sp.]
MDPNRVALIDDHEIIALALREAVTRIPGLAFAGVAPTVDQLLVRHPDAGLVVLDLRLADGSSPIGNVGRLVEHGAAVIAYTSGESPYLLRLVATTPILGIVRKSDPVSTLVETLQQAAVGRAVMSTEWAAAIDSDPGLDAAALSVQEQQVLRLFATGLKAQSVAAAMKIAVPTVEDYVRRIRSKYARIGRSADTKIDLYKRAIEDGFLPLPDSGS